MLQLLFRFYFIYFISGLFFAFYLSIEDYQIKLPMKLKDLEIKEDYRSADFLEPSKGWRRMFAEFWGTYLLVLVGAGGVVAAHFSGEVSKAMEVTAPGLMVIIYFMGAVSGAHLNPVVTLALALRSPCSC